MLAELKLTQWKKMGDHPLVTQETCNEFEYTEAKLDGAGFIDIWTIVYPGNYILEINNKFITIIGEEKAKIVFTSEQLSAK